MKNSVRTKTRVGKIRYINCIPYYHQLQKSENGDLEFYEASPAELNAAMQQEKIELAPISSLEYLNHQKDYLLLAPFIIGARDFSGSVLLFSREKIEALHHTTVSLSRESLSSAVLLKILLKFKYKFENKFVLMDSNPKKMLSECPAALVIGDDALFYQPEEFVYKYDLSELWWNWTDMPFCFALWAVRRDFAEANPEEVVSFTKKLKKNLNHNLTDIEGLIRDSLNLTFLDERFPKIFGYLFNLSYGMDPLMQEGLELYYQLAHRLGVSPRPKELEFFKG